MTNNFLPTEINVPCHEVDIDWHNLNEFEREELLMDWLSDTYGFCHYGFMYEETDGIIHITDIDWDTAE